MTFEEFTPYALAFFRANAGPELSRVSDGERAYREAIFMAYVRGAFDMKPESFTALTVEELKLDLAMFYAEKMPGSRMVN